MHPKAVLTERSTKQLYTTNRQSGWGEAEVNRVVGRLGVAGPEDQHLPVAHLAETRVIQVAGVRSVVVGGLQHEVLREAVG